MTSDTAVRPRSRPTGTLAAATAVALGVLLVLGPAPSVHAEVTSVASGQLTWGVKASFRSYVTGPVGDGDIEVIDGATTASDGTFLFPGATGSADPEAATLDLAFGGGVRFTAHAGALDLTIGAVRATRSGDTGALVADVSSRSLATGVYDTYDDVVLATLDFAATTPTTSGTDTTYADVPAQLTEAGSDAFADFYPAGTPLDPVTITTGTGSTTTTTSTTSMSTPSTTAPTTAPAPSPLVPYGTDTSTGVDGQSLTVTPVRDLDPAGERIRVSGTGYDPALGIYLAFCVDQGPDLPPSPCVGGVDMSGDSESAIWISDHPPAYGEDLARPFGPGGSFAAELTVPATTTDDTGATVVDCFATGTRCVVATRTDHTNSGERRADVKVPVYFAGQTPAPQEPSTTPTTVPTVHVTVSPDSVVAGGTVTVSGTGFLPGEQVGAILLPTGSWIGAASADASGAVTALLTVPADTTAGAHSLELRGLTSGRHGTSSTFQVLAPTGAPTPTLPATGASTALAVVGGLLVASGCGLLVATRRAARRALA